MNPENFDNAGKQRRSLAAIRDAPVGVSGNE